MQTAVALFLVILLAGVLGRVLVSVYTRTLSVKHFVEIIIGGVLSLFMAVVLFHLGSLSLDGYAFRHLEENARKVVTGDELQAWATKVLAHPDAYGLRTNYPGALRRVHPLCEPRASIRTNLDNPPFVTLDWTAADVLVEFQIGPTNFVGWGHKWQDGVYFLFEPH